MRNMLGAEIASGDNVDEDYKSIERSNAIGVTKEIVHFVRFWVLSSNKKWAHLS